MHPQIIRLKNEVCDRKKIKLSMLRLDEIHPVVSGNKIFKLHYFIDEAKSSTHKQVITFGGAYSNHLAATAFVCKKEGLKSVGIVRGEKSGTLSPTLKFCLENQMQLEFISRFSYRNACSAEFTNSLIEKYGTHTLIPEGGFSQKGAKGAEMIMDTFNKKDHTHVCCAIGTATTFAGLINGCDNIHIIGFSVLKNLDDIEERLKKLNADKPKKYSIVNNYHFGGYAKKTNELVSFMNTFYEDNKVPLDFVYTGKMMFGVYDLMTKNYFPNASNILCIHTGGLQGNQSLAAGVLNF